MNTRGITLATCRPDGSSVSLAELLRVVEPWTTGATSWLVGDAELSTGSRGSAELTLLAGTTERVTTSRLVELVADGVQLVDGDVSCFAGEADEPFLVLASVRGDAWDVRSDDKGLLAAVRTSFPGSADLPADPRDERLLCRVCGYRDDEPPWGADGRTPSFALCPCCGVEWGYQDSSQTGVARFREAWLAAGAPWRDPLVGPDGLTTEARLQRLGR